MTSHPDKQHKIGDDRAYTIAMLAWYLKKLRRESITKKPTQKVDVSKLFMFKRPAI